MEERYDVYFAGEVMAGFDARAVRDKLASVFNADQATLDKLFSGKAQLIKRDCDAATASKYKLALERAGAVPIIKSAAAATHTAATATTEATTTATPATKTAPGPSARAMTAAEKIALLAAAPDETRYQKRSPESTSADHRSTAGVVHPEIAPDSSGIVLAPAGTAVLREEERAEPVVREVDTSRLAIDSAATRLSDEAPPSPIPPDTGHLSMAAAGDRIPNLGSTATPLTPNLDGLVLSAAGTDFSDCVQPAPEVLPLDLSHLAALPPGDIPLEEQRRRPLPVATPDTDHIRLEE